MTAIGFSDRGFGARLNAIGQRCRYLLGRQVRQGWPKLRQLRRRSTVACRLPVDAVRQTTTCMPFGASLSHDPRDRPNLQCVTFAQAGIRQSAISGPT